MAVDTDQHGAGRGTIETVVHDEAVAALFDPTVPALPKSAKRRVLEDIPALRSSKTHNVITDDYLDEIARAMNQANSATLAQPTHAAVGTDGSAENGSQSALQNEVARDSLDTQDNNDNEFTATAFYDSGEANGNTIREVGLFDSASGGTMINRAVVPEESKTSGITLTVNYTITWSDGG